MGRRNYREMSALTKIELFVIPELEASYRYSSFTDDPYWLGRQDGLEYALGLLKEVIIDGKQ